MLHSPTLQNQVSGAGPAGTLGDLVQRSRDGDTTAFVTLYRSHVSQVYGFLHRRLADRDAAEEATQEVFTRALAGLHRCRSEAHFPGWLFGIARHVVSEQYKVARCAPIELAGEVEPADPDPSPEEQAVRAEHARELHRARERCLTASEQTLFDLLLAGLTDKQIATALNRRSGAIRTAHWRLMIKLRGCQNMLAGLRGAGNASV
jgi:RNA polymerase sigma-70 factor (ECF subfamily)